jgi:putative zinc finger/helix-turn-helix YgiT family protein
VEGGGHDCFQSAVATKATRKRPYHYLLSGLSNVYLIGIKYHTCRWCRSQWADIPAIKDLHRLIGKLIVLQPAPLSGEQIRYLRKRLGKKAREFAAIIDAAPETYSRWENDKQRPSATVDRLMRLYYALNCDDEELVQAARSAIEKVGSASQRRKKPPKIAAAIHGNRWCTQREAAWPAKIPPAL